MQSLDLITKEFNSNGHLLVHGDDLDGVAFDPKVAPDEFIIVAAVLHCNQLSDQVVPINLLPNLKCDPRVQVLFWCT